MYKKTSIKNSSHFEQTLFNLLLKNRIQDIVTYN